MDTNQEEDQIVLVRLHIQEACTFAKTIGMLALKFTYAEFVFGDKECGIFASNKTSDMFAEFAIKIRKVLDYQKFDKEESICQTVMFSDLLKKIKPIKKKDSLILELVKEAGVVKLIVLPIISNAETTSFEIPTQSDIQLILPPDKIELTASFKDLTAKFAGVANEIFKLVGSSLDIEIMGNNFSNMLIFLNGTKQSGTVFGKGTVRFRVTRTISLPAERFGFFANSKDISLPGGLTTINVMKNYGLQIIQQCGCYANLKITIKITKE